MDQVFVVSIKFKKRSHVQLHAFTSNQALIRFMTKHFSEISGCSYLTPDCSPIPLHFDTDDAEDEKQQDKE